MEGDDRRFVGPDILRFFVATVVLCAHANNFGDAGIIFTWLPKTLGVPLNLAGTAWVAVDIFFVLSGFLISGLLFTEAKKKGTVSLGRFLIRRGFKIYPAFWAMLAVSICWTLARGGGLAWPAVLGEFFYFQNYGFYVGFHTWSLAVEEHFYFLLAGLFWVLIWRTAPGKPVNFDCIPDLFLATALLCLAARLATWWLITNITSQTVHWFDHADHALLDALGFGVLLSHWWHNCWNESTKQRLRRWRWAFGILGLALLAPGIVPVMDIQWFRIFGFTLVYMGAGALLLASLTLDYGRCPFWARGFAWLGRHSYSAYLWHVMAGNVLFPWVSLNRPGPGGWALNALIYLAVAWAAGVVMAKLVEFPALRLRDRWFPPAGQSALPSRPGASFMMIRAPRL